MSGALAIDPGVAGRGCACAAFDADGWLVETWFERAERDTRRRCSWVQFDVVVVERPQQDGRSRAARPKDLIDLAWEGALLAGQYGCGGRIVELTPAQWKGSTPKPVSHARLWACLSPAERDVLGGAATYAAIQRACEKGALKRWTIPGAACYPKTWDTHNLLDAAALGCTYLGRLTK